MTLRRQPALGLYNCILIFFGIKMIITLKRAKKPFKFEVNILGHKIRFGACGYEDYTIHKNKLRKILYLKRHAKDHVNDLMYAGFWAKNILWNKPTIEASIRDTEKLIGIPIRYVKK